MNRPADRHNIEGLDALRGILSLIVCIAHSWQIFVNPVTGDYTPAHYLWGLSARFAVLGFFCLSGYVIALSAQKNIQRNGSFRLADYMTSRAFRILPPLLFVILLALVFQQVLHLFGLGDIPQQVRAARHSYSVNLKSQLASIVVLCLHGDLTGRVNGPLWSLAYEIQMYVIAGLFMFGVRGKAATLKRTGALGLLCGFIALAFILETNSHGMKLVCFLSFLSGWIALWYFRKAPRNVMVILSASALAAALALFLMPHTGRILDHLETSPRLLLGQLSLSICATALIVLLSRVHLLSSLATLGRFSYTLYIVHFIFMLFLFFIVHRLLPHYSAIAGWVMALTGGSLSILLARFVSRTIENTAGQRLAVRKLKEKYTLARQS